MNYRSHRLEFFVVLGVAVLLTGWMASTTSAQKTKKTQPKITYYSVPAGQRMRVRLNDEIGSEKSHVGETFTATLVDPVYSNKGVLLAPQGSIVNGRVVNIQRAQKKGKPGTMDVEFVSMKLPNGRSVRLNGSLTELSTSSGSSDNEGTVSGKQTTHRKAKFIGGGAGGGAVIGAIAGGGTGLAIGAGVGALSGAIAGRLKKGPEVKVAPGTEFGVILNQAIALPRYAA